MYFNLKYTVIGLWTIFALCDCQRIGDQFRASRRHYGGMGSSSEEIYHHNSPVEDYYYQQGFHPEAMYGNIHNPHHQYPYTSGTPLYQPMPIAQPHPDIVQFDSFSNQGFFPREPFFQPQVRAGAFENPLKKVVDPMRKQMEDSIKEMGDNMGKQMDDVGKQLGEAGKQLPDSVQKPAEELGKQMKDAMDDAREQLDDQAMAFREGVEQAGTAMPFPRSSADSDDDKKKLDDAAPGKKGDKGDGEDMSDAKKNSEGGAAKPTTTMQDTVSKPKKKFPVPGHLIGSIKDETTEVHDEDDESFPRAEAMEWGPPHFVDVRYHHPRPRYFDYYYDDGGY